LGYDKRTAKRKAAKKAEEQVEDFASHAAVLLSAEIMVFYSTLFCACQEQKDGLSIYAASLFQAVLRSPGSYSPTDLHQDPRARIGLPPMMIVGIYGTIKAVKAHGGWGNILTFTP
jgi:hypothetical protein